MAFKETQGLRGHQACRPAQGRTLGSGPHLKAKVSPNRNILAYLAIKPTGSRRDIAERLRDITEDEVKHPLARLQAMGALPGAKWHLIDLGSTVQ